MYGSHLMAGVMLHTLFGILHRRFVFFHHLFTDSFYSLVNNLVLYIFC